MIHPRSLLYWAGPYKSEGIGFGFHRPSSTMQTYFLKNKRQMNFPLFCLWLGGFLGCAQKKSNHCQHHLLWMTWCAGESWPSRRLNASRQSALATRADTRTNVRKSPAFLEARTCSVWIWNGYWTVSTCSYLTLSLLGVPRCVKLGVACRSSLDSKVIRLICASLMSVTEERKPTSFTKSESTVKFLPAKRDRSCFLNRGRNA